LRAHTSPSANTYQFLLDFLIKTFGGGKLEQYKQDFIDFLLETGALKIGGDFTLKSKRQSPYFVNMGNFNDGQSISKLGQAYASAIQQNFDSNSIEIYTLKQQCL